MAKVLSNLKVVNKVMTKVLTIGGGVDSNPNRVIIVLPGNPGLSQFYQTFMTSLHEKVGVPIWCIGQAGHDVYNDPPLKGNEDLYSLDGQIQHKISFLRDNLEPGAQVTLVAHSLGCKLALDVMKQCQGQFKLTSYMMFPMIERMYESPNGKSAWIQANYLPWLLSIVAFLANLLPFSAKTNLIRRLYQKGNDDSITHAIADTVNPSRIRNALFLAYHELMEIKDPDLETISGNLDAIRFYYGAADGWAPIQYYNEMVENVPGVKAELCNEKIPHAFVLEHSEKVADIVSRWFKLDN